MGLDIKHLAPYIPYGIEVQFGNRAIIDRGILTGVSKATDSVVQRVTTNKHYEEPLWLFRPVLVPLSAFDCSDYQDIKTLFSFSWCMAYEDYFERWFSDLANTDKLVLQAPYEIFQWFLENHYDVFNLISSNLAIEKI